MSEVIDLFENKFLQFQAIDPSYTKEQFIEDCKASLREKLQINIKEVFRKVETGDLVNYLTLQKDVKIEDDEKQKRPLIQSETRPEARGKRSVRKES